MLGRKLGRYRIREKLGEGGLASVWQAHDELLGRTVAVKTLDAKWAQSPDVVRRFLHEGQSTAALAHPGIVAVYDSGMEEGVPYLVLERIDGEVLSDRLRRSRLPIAEAVRIVRAVANALAHAHAHGVIHRDVTGRNIMLARDRRVIVLDFGLALAAWESRLTATGTRMGTAPYIAPELLRGQAADARSDVYSLGVVLYEALTGGLPFAGNNQATVFHRALHEDPAAPIERRPDVPPALNEITLRAIAREPDQRFRDMKAFASALAGAETASPVPLDRPGNEAHPAPAPPWPAVPPGRPDPLYLVVLPFSWIGPSDSQEDARAHLTERLVHTLRARLASESAVRIVATPTIASAVTTDPAAIARAAGANAVLRGTASAQGSSLRVTYEIVDTDRGVQFAGGVVDGSTFRVFDLEDLVVGSVRAAVVAPGDPISGERPSRGPDPARDEHLEQALASLKRYDSEAAVDGAVQQLEALADSEGVTARVRAGLARAYLHKYRITKQRTWEARAAAEIERGLAQDPDALDVHLALGDLQFAVGTHALALAEYHEVLAREPQHFDALLGLARTRLAMGDTQGAEQAAQAAIAATPADWRGHNVLGVVRFHLGDYPGTLDPWSRVVELTPDNALGHLNLGTCHYHLDHFEEAASAYERSLALQPSPSGFSNLGTVLFFLGENERAAAALRKAAVLRPADPALWGNLGNALRWIPGHEAECVTALDRAIDLAYERLERNPSDFDLWGRTAGWLAGRRRVDEARSALEHAFAIAPEDPDVTVRAAYLHVDLGEIDEGLAYIRKAVERGFPVTEFRRGPELASLRGTPVFEEILARGLKPPTAAARPPAPGTRTTDKTSGSPGPHGQSF